VTLNASGNVNCTNINATANAYFGTPLTSIGTIISTNLQSAGVGVGLYGNTTAYGQLNFYNGSGILQGYVASVGAPNNFLQIGSSGSGGISFLTGNYVTISSTGLVTAPNITSTLNSNSSAMYASSNVSINTPPINSYRLSVADSAGNCIVLYNPTGGTGASLNIDSYSYTSFFSSPPSGRIQFSDGGNYADAIIFYNKISGSGTNALAERMRIDLNGNIGLNKSNPSYLLDCNGSGNISGSLNVGNNICCSNFFAMTTSIYTASASTPPTITTSLVYVNAGSGKIVLPAITSLLVGTIIRIYNGLTTTLTVQVNNTSSDIFLNSSANTTTISAKTTTEIALMNYLSGNIVTPAYATWAY
jgi:hypothetical protein